MKSGKITKDALSYSVPGAGFRNDLLNSEKFGENQIGENY